MSSWLRQTSCGSGCWPQTDCGVISIAESRVDELRRAQSLQVSAWARKGKAYRGTLRELAPDTDSVTRTYSARITVHDADARELMLGMTAS
jgi:membrane fusion protein, multidrug efflux system